MTIYLLKVDKCFPNSMSHAINDFQTTFPHDLLNTNFETSEPKYKLF